LPGGFNFGGIEVLPTIQRGFGIATINYADIDPDVASGLPFGVRSLYLKPGQTMPASDEWGSIFAWAWGHLFRLGLFLSIYGEAFSINSRLL
jgi:hypothetical protein